MKTGACNRRGRQTADGNGAPQATATRSPAERSDAGVRLAGRARCPRRRACGPRPGYARWPPTEARCPVAFSDKDTATPTPDDFSQMQGIVVIKGHGWGNASGHVTLWNGTLCADSCHLLGDPDNGSFVPESGALWVLP
ncbi:T6SS effector amidase Tae4 family protein [Denitromonas iodatirespirans]|uniref:T6SS effector amidase Tae4 family protein n=1 Tax=Denitromonas iodatirespirans TaxID=2795389 RepID=UPI002106EC18|nr:T6SS effector amidase Tae4 family protein [Denitromonas iodatirespirans]